MANDGSPSGRTGSGRRCGTPTRVDLLTLLLAAMLCSASYYLGIWHNSRGAADSRILGPSAAVVSCYGDDSDEPLDFEARHGADGAGLSVSSSSSATGTGARRALLGAAPGRTGLRGVAWAARAGGGGLRFTDAGGVSA